MVIIEVHGVTGVDVSGLSSLGAFELLCRHVREFNQGVRTGDFSAMVAEFTDEAEMVFDGIPVGPFRGRAQIAAAYAGSPPDDTIRLLRCARGDSSAVADYAWSADPGVLAGHMELRFDGGRISRLAITYLR
jgi:hypothetical protein